MVKIDVHLRKLSQN